MSLFKSISVDADHLIKVLPAVDKKRPVNLDIGTIKLPITSYVSILHRVSGVIMFFSVAIFLWMLESSLASEQSFNELGGLLSNPICQFIIWGSLAALAYHAIAGIRHLIMDFGFGVREQRRLCDTAFVERIQPHIQVHRAEEKGSL